MQEAEGCVRITKDKNIRTTGPDSDFSPLPLLLLMQSDSQWGIWEWIKRDHQDVRMDKRDATHEEMRVWMREMKCLSPCLSVICVSVAGAWN
jgi:hypothetical protein